MTVSGLWWESIPIRWCLLNEQKPRDLGYQEISMLESMLLTKDFLTWHLIQSAAMLENPCTLTWVSTWVLLSNPSPRYCDDHVEVQQVCCTSSPVVHSYALYSFPRTKCPPFRRRYFLIYFLDKKFCISIQRSWKLVPKGPLGNKSALAQVMPWPQKVTSHCLNQCWHLLYELN